MIYVPLKHLKPGMILARDVTCGSCFFSLLVAGQKLSSSIIAKLAKNNIQGVYIQSQFCGDLEVTEVVDSELKQTVITELKHFYNDYASHATISLSSIKAISNTVNDLVNHILSKEECLINIVDIKDYDTYTYTHSMYVCILCILIGIQQCYPKSTLTELGICGLLHDIGKLDVPLEIINKKSVLTNEEFKVMQSHPDKAVVRLSPCHQISSAVLKGILTHHEKYNGTGYPQGLMGKNIPLYGRITALADVYDALTSQRSYRKAWSSSDAIEYMMGCADTHFDFELLQSFLKTVAIYPVGTVVELSNGFIAVVIQNSAQNILRPKIRLLLPQEHTGEEIDLADTNNEYLNVTIKGVADDEMAFPEILFV
ncbi:HD-GYP domain-containing protein (c-di-GMP phosphodiesterase class II) [Hydrogenoanaerobacterium saccharovorans]|uniref:HD-GYP domain, c-di-GMP phosphodiesterase class II (Or its inactivated variant) n=1 Tax=Hydrogenoanaerobacterium saccharovorans TaxID=474960 RepID=A0A1H7YNC0_9FIRM|nr:HD-GYP domain-containing protein [Hydrogenoanaerobacterium saccharovorans]RPF49107.1 HD-GYP domain-containing protein (c-di-GMP phosphodiesterase class II) [Hydrogenoanaerobacterium saccharovorans]SEM47722.1 HD-GYP domain, c-di-GMP phosphodiesterase class II (or its inactivated variant) [Hydrogenoanaerobacterium saccharovorans]